MHKLRMQQDKDMCPEGVKFRMDDMKGKGKILADIRVVQICGVIVGQNYVQ